MDKIVYPITTMRATAQQIRTNATNSLCNHEQTWQRLQNCLAPLPGFIQAAFNIVLNTHNQRLRASFQWQIDLATRLEESANAMEKVDQSRAQSFQ